MTKFEQKSFSTPANTKAFRDNWAEAFAEQCPDCGLPRHGDQANDVCVGRDSLLRQLQQITENK